MPVEKKGKKGSSPSIASYFTKPRTRVCSRLEKELSWHSTKIETLENWFNK